MEKIVRHFKVERSSGYITEYPMTTYSVIFDSHKPFSNLEKLANYLRTVFVKGVPDSFRKKSVSQESNFITQKTLLDFSELCDMAKRSNYEGKGKDQHMTVQEFFLNWDKNTIAYEVPVYDEEYHGHIDLIRVMPDDRIQVLDFKPKALNEVKAAAQVMRYKILLSKLTGIALSDIDTFYFDNTHAYQVTL